MYHRVASAEHDPWGLCVTPDNFREQVLALTCFADVVPLPDLARSLRSSNNARPAIAITFDDGYLDNFSNALPVLREFDAPATFFIATDAIGRNEPFWWDTLAALILGGDLPQRIRLFVGDAPFEWSSAGSVPTGTERRNLLSGIWARLQRADDATRRNAIRELIEAANLDGGQLLAGRAMNEEELLHAQASGLIELGGHTASHCPLPKRIAVEQRNEIRASRDRLKRLTGRAPTSFAYPYGAFDQTSRDLAVECGFQRACTTREDLVWAGDDPMLLSRFAVPDGRGHDFENWLRRRWLA